MTTLLARAGLALAGTLVVLGPSRGGDIDPALAHQYFQEAEALGRRDGGRLWGIALNGPLLFADPQTRQAVANRPDREGKLVKEGSVYVGRLPKDILIANTSVAWAGEKWTQVRWPLPKDPTARAILMMHESWHRVQQDLGFPMNAPGNHHLDTSDGRVWLQLEWRALAAALRGQGDPRRQAVADALLFRAHRRSLFPSAGDEERTLEMHEGLAEYTGYRLCGLSAAAAEEHAAKALLEGPRTMPTFVRSFAYLSGPAYGLLLDGTGASWRQGLKPNDDLGKLLRRALDIQLPDDVRRKAKQRSAHYQGEALAAAEAEREKRRQERLTGYRRRLVDGPVLQIPLRQMRLTFDPNNLLPLDDRGTVYPTLKVSDTWGTLTVTEGALLAADFTRVIVPAPAKPRATPVEGLGWKLEMKDGWELRNGARMGDYVLEKTGP